MLVRGALTQLVKCALELFKIERAATAARVEAWRGGRVEGWSAARTNGRGEARQRQGRTEKGIEASSGKNSLVVV